MLQPAVIDGLAFARNGLALKGRLGLDGMPRLAQSGCVAAEVDFVLAGEINERAKPELRLEAEGKLRLECQRCLGELEVPLHFAVRLELASSETEVAAAEDNIERIVAGREMDVAVLVEDEVLLALPMVPKHEHCQAASGVGADAKPSAFQALAALKKTIR